MKNGKAMEYISKYFGKDKNFISESYDGISSYSLGRLPVHIREKYVLTKARIMNVDMILAYDHQHDFSLKLIESVKYQLEDNLNSKVVFIYDYLSFYQRKSLIEKRISFVVPDSYLFITEPFILFEENRISKPKVIERMSLGTQYLFISCFDKLAYGVSRGKLAILTKRDKMFVSRAVNELLSLNLIKETNYGLVIKEDKLVVWRSASKYFKYPIKEIVYVKNNASINNIMIPSGILALNQISNLHSDELVYAIESREWEKHKHLFEIAYKGDYDVVKVEIWKSFIPMKNNMIHPLALYLSLLNEYDARVRIELNRIIEAYLDDEDMTYE